MMNRIQLKLILWWALSSVYCVLVLLHHLLIAQLVMFPILLAVRYSIPRAKSSVRMQRIGYIFAGVFIFLLVLVLIHSWDPFPPSVVRAFEIVVAVLALVFGLPFAAFGIHSDYMLFKGSCEKSA
jgi:hypothetical protein